MITINLVDTEERVACVCICGYFSMEGQPLPLGEYVLKLAIPVRLKKCPKCGRLGCFVYHFKERKGG